MKILKKIKSPGNYQFADQYARLEAVRAYVQAANEILAEAQAYERRSADPTYVRRGVTAASTSAKAVNDIVQKLMADMQSDLAVEGGEKLTVQPPGLSVNEMPTMPEFPPQPIPRLDDPFAEEK